MKSIIACSTASLKEANEDSCCVINNEKIPLIGVIVADGLGSHKHSDKASAFVTKFLKEKLEAIENINDLDFETLFQSAKKGLVEDTRNNPELNYEELSKGSALSTTVICAIETVDKFIIVYAGNGSAWQIRGSFNQFSESRYLPWNSINLLNPHCVEEKGKSALYRYISISDVKASPTIVTISKNVFAPSEWIMICTDGIYTYDSVIIGKDQEGKIWISGEETMEMFYESISSMLSESPKSVTSEDLQFCLDRYLQEIKEKKLMNDDCTIGVIIPEVVLRFQESIIENKKAIITNEANPSN